MSSFRNTVTGDVISVPPELDAMYRVRPEFVDYDPEAPGLDVVVDPAATAPAGSTGAPVPTFDPDLPLAAGAAVALDHIEDIKGQPLDESLKALGLDSTGKADEKRDRLAERLNEEVTRG